MYSTRNPREKTFLVAGTLENMPKMSQNERFAAPFQFRREKRMETTSGVPQTPAKGPSSRPGFVR